MTMVIVYRLGAIMLSMFAAGAAYGQQAATWPSQTMIYEGHNGVDYANSFGCPNPAENAPLAAALKAAMATQGEPAREAALNNVAVKFDGCSFNLDFSYAGPP